MINFTKTYVNVVSFIISIIVFFFLNNYIFSIQEINLQENFVSNNTQNINIKNQTKENNNQNTVNPESDIQKQSQIQSTDDQNSNNLDWNIEIPKINLKAKISEGTSKEIMDVFVGHFEETAKDIGNIGLAAHNRGYKVNYFQDLKKLEEGDEILYKYNGKQRKYFVKTHKIIKDTDWTLLENTYENRITLITCVENEPEYRRCIQAIEVN